MKKIFVICLFVLLTTSLAFAEMPTETNQPSAGAVVGDLLMRPFVAAGSIITTSFCIVTMPLPFIMGVGEQWARVAIEAPWRFTVARPLGDFNHYYDGNPVTVLHR